MAAARAQAAPREDRTCRGHSSPVPLTLPPLRSASWSPDAHPGPHETQSVQQLWGQSLRPVLSKVRKQPLAHWALVFLPPEIANLEGLDPFPKCGVGSFQNMWTVPVHLFPGLLGCLKIHREPLVIHILVVKQVGLYY